MDSSDWLCQLASKVELEVARLQENKGDPAYRKATPGILSQGEILIHSYREYYS